MSAEFRRRTDVGLIVGGFVILIVVGGAILWLLYGNVVAFLGVVVVTGGALALAGLWLALRGVEALLHDR